MDCILSTCYSNYANNTAISGSHSHLDPEFLFPFYLRIFYFISSNPIAHSLPAFIHSLIYLFPPPVQLEIEDRRRFLETMTKLGRAGEYRNKIETEISQVRLYLQFSQPSLSFFFASLSFQVMKCIDLSITIK